MSKISLVLLILFCVRAGAEAEGEDPNMTMKDGSRICATCGQTPTGSEDSLVNSQLVEAQTSSKSIKAAIDATRIKLPKDVVDLSPEEIQRNKNKERFEQSMKRDDQPEPPVSTILEPKLKGGIPIGGDARIKIRRKGISVEKKGIF